MPVDLTAESQLEALEHLDGLAKCAAATIYDRRSGENMFLLELEVLVAWMCKDVHRIGPVVGTLAELAGYCDLLVYRNYEGREPGETLSSAIDNLRDQYAHRTEEPC